MARKNQTEAWWRASRSLGFDLRADSNGNSMVPLWDTMASSLRPLTELTEHAWMVGAVDGVPAIITYYFNDGGSSADTHYTHAMVQIDPPLFLGMHLARTTWLSAVPKIGVPLFDAKLYVQAFQPERGHAMVWPGRHPPLADHALSAVARGLSPEVFDSFASTTVTRFEADPAVLRDMLGHSLLLARAAVERRTIIGEAREEAFMRSSWAQFAEQERLAFDAPRRSLSGSFQGFETRVLTRSTPTAIWTQFVLCLPTDTGMRVDVAPESGLTRFANVIGFSDIEVGDAAFDRALRLKGNPAPLVRAFFAREEARAQALQLVQKYGRFSVEGRFVSIASPTPADPDGLRAALTAMADLSRAVIGQARQQQGAYRGS